MSKLTTADVDRILTELQDRSFLESYHPKNQYDLPSNWDAFFRFDDIHGILLSAIHATCSQDIVSLEAFKYAIFQYTIVDYNWVARKLDNHSPDSFRGFFKQVIRHLLINANFMRNFFSVKIITAKITDPKTLEEKKVKTRSGLMVSMDDTTEKGRTLSESVSESNLEERAEAKEKLAEFSHYVNIIESKWPVYGELMRRRYLYQEDIRDIATDFLRQGKISVGGQKYLGADIIPEDVIKSATNNLLNRKLPIAREKFNALALSNKSELHFKKGK